MGSRAEWITNNEETHLQCFGFLDHLSTATLDKLTISNDDFLAEELGQALVGDHEDGRVHLKVDLVASLDSLHSLHRDIFLVAQTEPDHMQNHVCSLIQIKEIYFKF